MRDFPVFANSNLRGKRVDSKRAGITIADFKLVLPIRLPGLTARLPLAEIYQTEIYQLASLLTIAEVQNNCPEKPEAQWF